MSGHLSQFALDEAVAMPTPEQREHLDACEECRARVDALREENAKILASPHAGRVRNQLVGRHAAKPQRRWLVPAISIAAAAVVLFFVVPRPPAGDRLKGAAAIEVLHEGQVIAVAHPGEKVELRVASAGHGYAAVFAVDDRGEVTTLWPTSGATAQKLPQAITLLDHSYDVTEGSLALHAAFTDEPVALDELAAELKAGNAGSASWAHTVLEVR